MYEIANRVAHPADLLKIPYGEMVPVDLALDAEDVVAKLLSPAVGAQTDLHMAVYVAALRKDIAMGRIRHVFWIPNEWQLANVGTKLNVDGTSPFGPLSGCDQNGPSQHQSGVSV
jgi:hypothetical protein